MEFDTFDLNQQYIEQKQKVNVKHNTAFFYLFRCLNEYKGKERSQNTTTTLCQILDGINEHH